MILRRIHRLVKEQLENSGEGIRNFFSWLILAVLGWILWGFFQPLTFNFWVAATCIALSSLLIWSRRYRSAAAICGALVLYCIILSFRVTYIVASDQQGISYRQVAEVSYLTLPSNFPIIGMMPASFIRPKLISIISCDGIKVAKLPLLPFSATKADRMQFDSPLQFRRLQPLSYELLLAYVETQVGTSDQQREVSLAMGFSHRSDYANLTDIFPRSISCMENYLPLIPVMELLPWIPDQANQLISATAKVFSLRDAYLHGQITPQLVRTIRSDNDESNYNSLLDFTSGTFQLVMLQGNLFAEARADIRNQLCITVESNPNAFSGPFSSLSKQMKRELAYNAGRTYSSMYPACRIDDEVFDQIETLSTLPRDVPNWVTAMSDCLHSTTATELFSCLSSSPFYHKKDENCEAIYCGAALTGVIPSEDVVQFYEKPFEDRVISRDGYLIEPSTLDSIECPTLRDSLEDAKLLNWRRKRALSIWNEPIQCSSPDWQSRLEQAKNSRLADLQCARKKGFGGIYDDAIQVDFDLTYLSHCDPSGYKRRQSDYLVSILEMFDQVSDFKTGLLNYADWIGLRRTEDIMQAVSAFETYKTVICETRSVRQCVDEFDSAEIIKRVQEMVSQPLGLIWLSGKDRVAQTREILQTLSRLDNVVAKIAVCDLLARSDISDLTGMSRDTYCRSHGLSRYMEVSERYDVDSFGKTFGSDFIETREIRMVSPSRAIRSYGRNWIHAFPLSSK